MFELVWKKAALKGLRKTPAKIRSQIQQAMIDIAEDPETHHHDIKSMAGHTGYFRLRVGSYRAIFERADAVQVITVEKVGPRGDIYKH